jgi:hypothetical protein
MAQPPRLTFLAPGDALRTGLERIQRAGLDGLPVLDEGRLAGVLTRRGIARFVQVRREGDQGKGGQGTGGQGTADADAVPKGEDAGDSSS